MAVIKASSSDIDVLARLMRAEAEGEGEEGMLMAGNVMVNRTRVRCLDFANVNSIPDMAFQSPGGFEAVQKSYFYQRARERDRRLARRVINGERLHPAEFHYGFSAQTVLVQQSGGASGIQDATKRIVFINQRQQNVRKF